MALETDQPLIENISVTNPATDVFQPLASRVESAVFVTVGSRKAPRGHPPEMSI